MAVVGVADNVEAKVKAFGKSSNKNRFIQLTIGEDEDGCEEVQLWNNPDSPYNRDHLGGHFDPKNKKNTKTGLTLAEECKEMDVEMPAGFTADTTMGDWLDNDNFSRAARFKTVWELMQARIKKNKKDGTYFFIKVPYEKGGAQSEKVCFILYAGTRRKKKMLYSMGSRIVKDLVGGLGKTFESPLDVTAAEASNALASFV